MTREIINWAVARAFEHSSIIGAGGVATGLVQLFFLLHGATVSPDPQEIAHALTPAVWGFIAFAKKDGSIRAPVDPVPRVPGLP